RQDVGAEWFSAAPGPGGGLAPMAKDMMHQVDRGTPPTGPGWIIQVIGHHYNPHPSPAQLKLPENSPQRTQFGPYGYLVKRVLPKLTTPALRLYGIHHVALAWAMPDKEWTTEKGAQSNGLASTALPILDRAKAPAGASGSEGMAAEMGGAMMSP